MRVRVCAESGWRGGGAACCRTRARRAGCSAFTPRPPPLFPFPALPRSKTGVPVLGVVENMSGYLCPCCNTTSQVFPASGAGPRGMAAQFGVPFLGALPIDPMLLRSCETGVAYVTAYPDAPGVAPFLRVVEGVVRAVEGGAAGGGGGAASGGGGAGSAAEPAA